MKMQITAVLNDVRLFWSFYSRREFDSQGKLLHRRHERDGSDRGATVRL